MEPKKFLEDYTIKEIYMNFSFFEEKFSNIINDTKSFRVMTGNEFYSKLKFVKFLREYKNALDIMPYMHKYSDLMLDKILDEVKYVNTGKLDKTVEYDFKDRKFIFNMASWENEISDDMMYQLTNIALKDVKTVDNNKNKEYEELDKIRIEYISNKLINIKNNKEYDSGQHNSQRLKTYDMLIRLFGAETMLNLNSSNLPKLSEEYKKYKYYGGGFELVEDAFKLLKDKELPEKYYKAILKYLNNMEENIKIKRILIEKDKKEPTENAKKEINKFIEELNSIETFPESIKQQMEKNLYRGVKDVITGHNLPDCDGNYYPVQKIVGISNSIFFKMFTNERQKVVFHELMHGASTPRDEFGIPKRSGFHVPMPNAGVGINEGATEYFAQKLYKKIGKSIFGATYLDLVLVTKDMVSLYGENVILDAMVNGPEKLEELMKKDGKSYTEFREITDDFYRCVYKNKDKKFYNVFKRYKLEREAYLKIGNFIEEIKQKRAIENPGLTATRSEWKSNKNYFLVENMFSSIKQIFSLSNNNLLSEGNNNLDVDVKNKKEEFRSTLRQENFRTNSETAIVRNSSIPMKNEEKQIQARSDEIERDN